MIYELERKLVSHVVMAVRAQRSPKSRRLPRLLERMQEGWLLPSNLLHQHPPVRGAVGSLDETCPGLTVCGLCSKNRGSLSRIGQRGAEHGVETPPSALAGV